MLGIDGISCEWEKPLSLVNDTRQTWELSMLCIWIDRLTSQLTSLTQHDSVDELQNDTLLHPTPPFCRGQRERRKGERKEEGGREEGGRGHVYRRLTLPDDDATLGCEQVWNRLLNTVCSIVE
jgi:hypothetical protein